MPTQCKKYSLLFSLVGITCIGKAAIAGLSYLLQLSYLPFGQLPVSLINLHSLLPQFLFISFHSHLIVASKAWCLTSSQSQAQTHILLQQAKVHFTSFHYTSSFIHFRIIKSTRCQYSSARLSVTSCVTGIYWH